MNDPKRFTDSCQENSKINPNLKYRDYTTDLLYIAGIGHQIFLHLNSGIIIPCLYNNLINLPGLPI